MQEEVNKFKLIKKLRGKHTKQVVALIDADSKAAPQRSKEWYEARYNMITASDLAKIIMFDSYLDDLGKKGVFDPIGKTIGKHCQKFGDINELFKKKAEPMGTPRPMASGAAIEHGVVFECAAQKLYEELNNTIIMEFGCLPHSDPKRKILGASPDGITLEGTMIEIKCPMQREITGKVPLNYWIQMQLQMEVCNLPETHFLELKIEPYVDMEQYLEDCVPGGPYNKTKVGHHKGIVMEINELETRTRRHFCMSFNHKSHEQMLDEISDEYCNRVIYSKTLKSSMYQVRYIPFYVSIYSCVSVKRDTVWFNSVYPTIEKFWNEVLEARETGVIPEKYRKELISDFKNSVMFKTQTEFMIQAED
jgi:hypothetical protein